MARSLLRKGVAGRVLCFTLSGLVLLVFLNVAVHHLSLSVKSDQPYYLHGDNIANFTDFFYRQNRPDRLVTSFDCRQLVHGDKSAVELAKRFTIAPLAPELQVQFLNYQLLKSCDDFIQRRGYVMDDTDSDFPVAFSILFHTNLSQVEQLIRAIYRPYNVICLHIDSKAALPLLNAALALTKCMPNVILAKQERVIYASISRLQAEINCMQVLLAHKIQWKYYINLVGQVFPLKTNSELVQILKIFNGSNNIEGLGGRAIRSRFTFRYIIENDEIKNTSQPHTPPPHGLQIVRGSAYGVFSRGFVSFVLHDERARDLLEWSRDTYSPDEHYWATLHHLHVNPDLKTPGGYSGKPTEVDWYASKSIWQDDKDWRCYSNRYIRGVCIYGVADLPQLTAHQALFANKFEMDFQPLALQCLQEWHHNRTVQRPDFDTSFYKSLRFIPRS